jgi:membrane-associated phospholipid phosphatase
MKITPSALRVSAFFWTIWILVYPLCNWLTSYRANVHTFYFEWEHHLPFVPVLIIPYLSIDLFLATLPFLIKRADELHTYGLRIVTATLIAGVCYLAFPMSFGWDRPPVTGLVGVIITLFRSMDLPFNQCPSLHVAYLIIMFGPFMRNTQGIPRISIAIWFLLILVSTLFTYQHHCVDVLGGMTLGAICIRLFRPQTNPRAAARRAETASEFDLGMGCAAKAEATSLR